MYTVQGSTVTNNRDLAGFNFVYLKKIQPPRDIRKK